MKAFWPAITAALLASASWAETVTDRAGAVREDRANIHSDPRWIYNDWQKGFAEARRTGKPLLVVLRCVPCLACKGIDAEVLTQPDLAPLLAQFICVRLINANTLDLDLFQFDYDLSFSTLFFNGDGAIYGRFGSWTHQENSESSDTASFRHALEAALAIHQRYPLNKASLAGKQGIPMPVKDPLQLPQLAGKYKRDLDWDGQVVQSCVHCHQVSDALRASYRRQNQPLPRNLIYPMPAPETIGLTLAPEHIARVQHLEPHSIAANAGLQPGDDFISILGQPLVSIADVSWILHHAPESGTLPAIVNRAGARKQITLALTPGWRFASDISRRVGAWPMRAMAAGGLLLEDLTDQDRINRGLDMKSMALLVKHAGEYGEHAAAKNAGFRKNDLIIELDGFGARITESELLGRLLEKHPPGAKLNATVLRGAAQLDLLLPIQ